MSEHGPRLRDLQLWMRWAITDPRGVVAAIGGTSPSDPSCPERYREPSPRCLGQIVDEPPLTTIERLDVYAEGYFSRIVEVMSGDFSALRRSVGEGVFEKLIAEYLKRHPSRTANIGEVGRELGRFLAAFTPAQDSPWLAELAALEWACVESFYAEELPPLDPASFAAATEEEWQEATFVTDRSIRLMETGWSVHLLLEATEEPSPPASGAFPLLVQRRGGEARVESIDGEIFLALTLLLEGKSLRQICDAFADASTVMNAFGGWVAGGVIREISFPANRR